MAYAFSHALEKMAIEAKRWLDIPLFTNAWLHKEGKRAGDYPSGGPTKNVLNVWAKNAPSLTALLQTSMKKMFGKSFKIIK